jgi:dTDP-4-dehydrorhamnose 3,5-epimerase
MTSNSVQCNISYTKIKGTIRGLHYQKKPFEESKLIRCTKGKILDVVIDLRPTSKTYKKYEGFELSENNYKMVYVPEGFAHGFQTLEDNCEVFYQVSQFYSPDYESGIRWNDPIFNIKWPIKVTEISQKDKNWEFFKKD